MKRLLLPSIILITPFFLLLYLLQNFFSIKNIECRVSTNDKCPDFLVNRLEENIKGKPIIFTDLELEMTKEPFVSDSFALKGQKKKLPNYIEVVFDHEPIIYLIRTQKDDDKTKAVTQSGFIWETENSTKGVPVVDFSQTNQLSEQNKDPFNNKMNEKKHNPIKKIVSSLKKMNLPYQEIVFLSESEILLKIEDSLVAILDDKEVEKSVAELSAILSSPEYLEREEKVEEIDLRFRLPVLRTSQ